jgi:hypothetical protein
MDASKQIALIDDSSKTVRTLAWYGDTGWQSMAHKVIQIDQYPDTINIKISD